MGKEIRNGRTVETELAPSLHKKFKAYAKKENTSMAQILRDFIQKIVKK